MPGAPDGYRCQLRMQVARFISAGGKVSYNEHLGVLRNTQVLVHNNTAPAVQFQVQRFGQQVCPYTCGPDQRLRGDHVIRTQADRTAGNFNDGRVEQYFNTAAGQRAQPKGAETLIKCRQQAAGQNPRDSRKVTESPAAKRRRNSETAFSNSVEPRRQASATQRE
jgi:hypothetical protein